MPHPLINPPALSLPPILDLDALPQHVTPQQCAAIHAKYFGTISHRTIRESWPLEWRTVNAWPVTSASEFVAEARRRFDAAPVIRGGTRWR